MSEARSPSYPLTDIHLAELNRGLALVDDGLEQLRKAKQAGINVDVQEKALTDNRDKMLAIKQTYFPNR